MSDQASDEPQDEVADETPSNVARPSIALTTPFLALAAGLVAIAAFLLGYVVKDVGADPGRPAGAFVRMEPGPDGPGMIGPMGAAGGVRGDKQVERVTAGTVSSVKGNTVTLKSPSGETTTVKLDDDTFIVVRKAQEP